MKIGVFVSAIAGQKGYENNVSGHIQVPLESCNKLLDAGHDVHLITNEFGDDRSLPFCLNQNMKIHFVTDSRKSRWCFGEKKPPKRGVEPKKIKATSFRN